ncbi:putative bifunctional diguanylate cyclase/phosphodiesterase [Kineosporia babensis]|uniref:EAL domain-containing protein n=1 Tax=Kineosporia babensis TaxID=499548 RepID=A0A9X1SSZ1_9ACTN|nr:EAL domain-containing protein [Kineosporia babensis]MCD5311247.1 EAL domain-containing protein [Kineosporia babensis]
MNRLLLGLTWLMLAVYALWLTVRTGADASLLLDGILDIGTQIAAAALAWSHLRQAGRRRPEIVAMAAAVSVFALSNGVYVWLYALGIEYDFPAPTDYGFALFYPLVLIAVGLAARRELNTRAGPEVWMDSALGMLGSGAVIAMVLNEVLLRASGNALGASLALFYPLCDLFLAAFVLGMIAMQGRRLRPYWLLLLGGLTAFTVIDMMSALSLLTNSYQPGGGTDVLWTIGLVLMATWTVDPHEPAPDTEHQPALLLPGLATLASLAVLVAAGTGFKGDHVSGLALGLAVLTQVAAGVRTLYAFRQLRRLTLLRKQASTDDLTGLANRRAFHGDADGRLRRLSGRRSCALLLVDLDRFKEVNDSLGHHIGDRLLLEIGRRLEAATRPGDLLARLGGDEFAIFIEDVDEPGAELLAESLRAEIARPFTLEGIALRTDASIGMVLAPEHGDTLTLLLRRADIAMYQAKRQRRGQLVYSGDSDDSGPMRLRILQELHSGLEQGQMALHYQPKLDLVTGEVHAVEALVRWSHPERGLLYPDSFLTLAEDAGMMRRLNQAVLTEALDQAALWHRARRPLSVAVNLSPSSLVDADLPYELAAMLNQRGLPAEALEIEVTEEFLMSDHDRTREILTRLRDLGIRIAVDDFGTGYSSLAYLRELPVDDLKLDRSFVFPMAEDARAAALVFSTIELAHSLGLHMVAEGVEDQTTLTALAENGCDQAQGYFIARPLAASALDDWLATRERTIRAP